MSPTLSRFLPDAAKDRLRSASSLLGRSTSSLRTLPTFLIAGAQRCGTTALFKALAQHPQIAGPTWRKGVHYFDIHYARGLGWYRSHFPIRLSVRGRPGGFPIQIGESSPYYLFHPLAAERIARDLPDARILVLLRDPVERAYSAHAHESARGFETEPFERALDLEEERLAGAEARMHMDPSARSFSHQHHAYLRRGQYIEQLRRFEMLFGRARIHIVDSNDFFRAPERAFAAIESFLGVVHNPWTRFDRHNARPRSAMGKGLRSRLEEHFAPYDADLAEWLGRTPGWRR